jgi:membrane dipeptidase
MRVADFHCDLLWYLSNDPRRTVWDTESQSSIPLLKEGGVKIQVFPIYTVTGVASVWQGTRQFEIFDGLIGHDLKSRLAIENASSFCLEQEPLEKGLARLQAWHAKHPIAYISFTWNEENRFGGGSATQIGLKEDGKKLLEWMHEKKIAVDLSHASDALAYEILQESKMLKITPIASHSNFRAVCDHERNLSDSLAREIAQRGGLIGLNMVRHFLYCTPSKNCTELSTELGMRGVEDLVFHVHHAHKLGIENHLCMGADFFPEVDVEAEKAHLKPYFFEGFSTSACYPKIRKILCSTFSESYVEDLMYHRISRFLEE